MNTATKRLSQSEFKDALAAISQRMSPPKKSGVRRWMVAVSALALIAVASLVLPTLNFTRHAAAEELHLAPVTERSVSVVHPLTEMKQVELLLPAEVHAYQTTAIHARIPGYLKSWSVDRGARVKTGQVLAEIDAPEFDQELLRARSELDEGKALVSQANTERDQAVANLAASRANVLKSEANLELALKTHERFKNLVEKWAASEQQLDETVRNAELSKAELTAAKANVGSFTAAVASREAAIRTAEARVNSLTANVRRLEQTEAFKTIVAPFDGIITRRSQDVGALIATDGSRELFTLAQDNVLRITANVPQSYAALMHEGQNADIVAREFAQQDLKATVARTAGAIDSAARTLAVELEFANTDRKLLPGAFTQIRFLVQDTQAAIRIPANTLRFTKDGTQVVAVDANRQLQTLPVKLGRDNGTQVEVLSGLNGREALVVNPTDNMNAGERVNVLSNTPTEVAGK